MPLSMIELFNAFHDYSAGTLWRIREDLLMERVPCYDQQSDRLCHPGLSIRRGAITNNLERIPMLLGRSKRSGGRIEIKDVFPSGGKDYITHFGNEVVPLKARDFSFAPEAKKYVGDPLYIRSVVRNPHKPKVDASEKDNLLQWMSRKGF